MCWTDHRPASHLQQFTPNQFLANTRSHCLLYPSATVTPRLLSKPHAQCEAEHTRHLEVSLNACFGSVNPLTVDLITIISLFNTFV